MGGWWTCGVEERAARPPSTHPTRKQTFGAQRVRIEIAIVCKILFSCEIKYCSDLYSCSSGVRDGLSQKDKLYNKLVESFKHQNLRFPKGDDSSYFIQVCTLNC
jgi:hypothetical protein